MRNSWKEHFIANSGGRTDPSTYESLRQSYVSAAERADMLRAEKKNNPAEEKE